MNYVSDFSNKDQSSALSRSWFVSETAFFLAYSYVQDLVSQILDSTQQSGPDSSNDAHHSLVLRHYPRKWEGGA